MGFLGLSWYIWCVLALIVAGVFAYLVPREAQKDEMSRTKYIIVRWFRSLVWVLLALSFFLHGIGNANLTTTFIADIVAISGGVVYAVFFVATLRGS